MQPSSRMRLVGARMRSGILSRRAPGPLRVLRETDPGYVLLDGTPAEYDRAGDSRADFSQKHRRHDVNVQVVADPAGKLPWIPPALPGRTHDLTAARAHRIIRICERQGVPVLADRACIGACSWATTLIRRLPHQDLTATQRTSNRALSAARAPVDRSVARPKSWRVFRRARCTPNRMTAMAAAVLTLQRCRSRVRTAFTIGVSRFGCSGRGGRCATERFPTSV